MHLGCVAGYTQKIQALLSGHPIKGQNYKVYINHISTTTIITSTSINLYNNKI